MNAARLTLISGLLCCLVGGCTRLHPVQAKVRALSIVAIERQTRDGQPVRGQLAVVPLSRAEFDVAVEPSPRDDAEASLATLETFAVMHDCDVVINTNYFALVGPRRREGYKVGVDADILGLCIREGRTISPVREHAGKGDPALLIFPDHRAVIARVGADQTAGVICAAAGIGGSESDPGHGGLLLASGVSTAGDARVDPLVRHPRTAAGVSRDGRTLYLLVLDGRQAAWSVGATLEETAQILIEAGAWDAVNFDGGGSSVMLWKDVATGAWRTSRPSGTSPRPVATGLGVRIGRGGS